MTNNRVPGIHPADVSVLPGMRGVRSWGAVLLAVLGTAAGIAVDLIRSDTLGWGLNAGFVAGCVAAVLLVRRGSLFTAMVQPPLVLVAGVLVATLLGSEGMLGTALAVVKSFPLMAIGTGAAIAIGLIRVIAQPMRGKVRPNRQIAHS